MKVRPAGRAKASSRSNLEAALLYQLEVVKLPAPVTEFRFAYPRRWRFDLAWPDRKVAGEIDGGLYIYGRHSRPAGQLADMEKLNSATLLGWKVLRVGGPHVTSGEALEWIEKALAIESPKAAAIRRAYS